MSNRYHFILLVFLVVLGSTASSFNIYAQDREIPASRTQMQLSFAPLVKQVSPAVVNIYTSRIVTQRAYNPFMNDPFFGRFFGSPHFGGSMRRRVENSLGSGVLVDAEGMIVTNAHVIEGADQIKVVLSDGREFEASLVITDEASDLALLKINEDTEELPYAKLKPSESLEVGDIVLAIGNPFGVGQTVTSGIVSAQGRSALDINDFNFFIQTDAAINPGNSGGPLVALDGGVVGINTAIFSRDGGSLGIGFAVSSEMVASVIAAAEQGQSGEGNITRPWIGVTAQAVTSDIAESMGLERPVGALIVDLHKSSPMKKAGIRSGDVVVSINGRQIRDAAEMKFRMATVALGEHAIFEIYRASKILSKKVEAMAPPEDPPRETVQLQGRHPLNGVEISHINPAVVIELDLSQNEQGVVVSGVNPRSQAARIVRPGDVVIEINGREIEDVGDAQKELLKGPSRKGWELEIKRNGQVRQILLR